MNSPILINISKEKLEELNYDPLKIAELEFNSDILPITIKKPFPQKEEVEEEEEEEDLIEEEEAVVNVEKTVVSKEKPAKEEGEEPEVAEVVEPAED